MSHKSCRLFVLFLLIAVPASGQVQARVAPSDDISPSLKPLVTAAVSSGHVRLTALALTRQIRLEVLSQTGELVYDSGSRPGNRLEWEATDQHGSELRDGIYGFIVTVEDLNGAVSHRQGIFKVGGGIVSFDTTSPETKSGASDDQEDVTILRPEKPSPFTLISHDGKEGWIESGSGGLSVYAGGLSHNRNSVPQLRLTPEGNLGIGVAEPTAKLEVAGLVRASEGFQFSDGTILKMADGFPVFVTPTSQLLSGDMFFPIGLVAASNAWDREGRPTKPGTSRSRGGPGMFGLEGGSPQFNTYYGSEAGASLGSGGYNSFFGKGTGYANTSGYYNSFFGAGAGSQNTEGYYNSFLGWSAGSTNITESNNSFIGAFSDGAAGITNAAAIGYRAKVTQSNSLVLGSINGVNGATASTNVGIGTTAPTSRLTVVGDIESSTGFKIGSIRVMSNPGTYNTFVGEGSGAANTGGQNNAFFGAGAGLSNTTGYDNGFFGAAAGYSNTSGNQNNFFGLGAGYANTTGSHNDFFGDQAGTHNTEGTENSFFGGSAGYANTTGTWNSLFGRQAGRSNTTGISNSFVGYQAGYSNLIGNNNAFVGAKAGYTSVGNYNSFFGSQAGLAAIGNNNTFVGFSAGEWCTIGGANAFLGASSGLSMTSESRNTLLGVLSDGATGIDNATAIGHRAKVTQSNSLVLGSISGINGAASNTKVGIGTTSPSSPLHVVGTFQVVQSSSPNDTTGVFQQFNTSAYSGFGYFGVEGSTPGLTMSGTSAYATFLGAGSSGSVLQLGSAGTIRMTINPSGNVGIGTASPTARLHVVGGVLATDGFSTPSDARLKQDIKPLAYGLDDILRLRPVSFYWRDRNDSKLNLGLIAQEVAPVIPEIVEKSKDETGTMGMNYSALIPVLIKAVQEQHQDNRAALQSKDAEIALLRAEVSNLRQQNAALDARLSALEHAMGQLTKLGGLK